MIKIITFILLVLCLQAPVDTFAQLQEGDVAPDWTMTDINGDTYHLYDILDQGKNVIIDFSATWCSPCWSYHNSGILEHLYETYGPHGTDELMVFFIEGDITTTSADLHGTGTRTFGDWVTGTPYPIFDITSQQILRDYELPFWPTIYTICNDKKIKRQGRFTISQFEDLLNECPEPVAPIQITNTSITNATCASSDDGSIILDIEGPNPPFSVYWSDGSNTNGTLANVEPGSYTAAIIDQNGGYLNVGPFQIGYDNEGVTIEVAQITAASCSEGLGSIDLSIINGTVDSYIWNTQATTQNINDLAPGTYSVTIVGSEGCEQIIDDIEVDGANVPIASLASEGTLTCTTPNIEIDASSSSLEEGDDVIWTTSDGNIVSGETTLAPNVDQAGIYTITITNQEGCSSESSIEISNPEIPLLAIESSNELTCDLSCITLNATGSSSGDQFTVNWSTLDGNFTEGISTLEPTICQPGEYTLMITNSENGCTEIETVIITQNIENPAIEIIGNTELNCNETEVTLSATNTDDDLNYQWTNAENSTISEETQININESGIYTLHATNSTNGCSSIQSIEISENTAQPTLSEISVSNEISCTNNTSTINATVDNTNNATYLWTLPSGETVTTTTSSLEVSSAGHFSLSIQNDNGCSASSEIDVIGTSDTPEALASSGTLSCNSPETTLFGTSNLEGISYSWTGPDGYTSDEQNPIVEIPGEYVLTVSTSNGCSSSTVTVVTGSTEKPIINQISGLSSCENGQLEINASGNNLSYQWTGPNGYLSNEQNPIFDQAFAGEYTCIVTNEDGCSSEASTTLEDQNDTPNILTITGSFDCSNGSLSIETEGNNEGYLYLWSGPNGFTSNEQNPTLEINQVDGEYTCVITSQNGCYTEATTNLEDESDIPIIIETNGDVNCNYAALEIKIDGEADNYTYSWTGPNGFISDEQNPVIENYGNGIYSCVVSSASGCTSSMEADIVKDIEEPDVTVSHNDIDCQNTTAIIEASATNSNLVYNWTGPDGFEATGSSMETTYNGAYTLVVTNPESGCQTTIQTTISQDLDKPIFEIIGNEITCNDPASTLSVESTSIIQSVAWSGPGITSANKYQVNPIITVEGMYVAKVTAENGCFESKDKTIDKAEDLDIEITSITDISCHGLKDGKVEFKFLTGTPPLSFNFDFSKDLAPGTYIPKVTDANGCVQEFTFNIIEPDAISITFDDITTYSSNEPGHATVNPTGGTPPYLYQWDNGETTKINLSLSEGEHTVEITDANRCKEAATVIIEHATGIRSIETLNDFQIRPNPNTGFFMVELEFSTTINFEIEVISILGNQIYSKQFENQQRVNTPIDLSHLQAGSYFLKINTKEGQAVRKMIIVD